MRNLKEISLTRRELLQVAGASVVAAFADRFVQPVPVRAEHLPLEDWRSYEPAAAPFNEWYHPLHRPEIWNAENGWQGAWSWGVSLRHLPSTRNARFESHGNPGQIIPQVVDRRNTATIGLGVATDDRYINDYKWGRDREGRRVKDPNWAVGMNIKTQPGALIRLVDPETGTQLSRDGRRAERRANDRGDIMVVLPDEGMVGVVWSVTDPTEGSYESHIWYGPDDDPETDRRINKIDARYFLGGNRQQSNIYVPGVRTDGHPSPGSDSKVVYRSKNNRVAGMDWNQFIRWASHQDPR